MPDSLQDSKYIGGATKLGARIASIRRSVQLPNLVEEIGSLLIRRTLDRFDREVDPDGNAWAPLSDYTLRLKRRLGYGDRGSLKRTLDLRSAIKVIRGGFGSFGINTGAGLRIGVQDPRIAEYARIQNYGDRKIPARRFLGIGRLDVKAVDSLMRRKASQINRAASS